MKETVAVIEFSNWHSECLYSECLLLKKNKKKVVLIIEKKLEPIMKNSVSDVVDELFIVDFKKGFKSLASLWKVRKLILERNIKRIFINSAQGGVAWKFFLFNLPTDIQIVGVIHALNKLHESWGQKIISRRINKYVLLNDLLTKYYTDTKIKKPLGVVYPIFFPKVPLPNVHKPQDELWITIPGSVDMKRRDYDIFMNPSLTELSVRIKFIILGNIQSKDGLLLKERIHALGLETYFVFFDHFVEQDLFMAYIKASDYIMPLVHPSKRELNKYVTSKISGTFNLSFAFKKPMLCPSDLKGNEDFNDSSLFYNMGAFHPFLNSLLSANIKQPPFSSKKWTIEEQTVRMAKLIV